MKITVWTIGRSTHSFETFVGLLASYTIEAVADVRKLPGSRRVPHFDQAEFSRALECHKIAYQWFPALGGRRRARKDSPNDGWRSLSFRGYADHLESDEFAAGLAELLE